MATAGWWLIAALALGLAELVVPGVFLIFLAIAAAITGAAALALPDLPLAAQLASFAVWSVVAVLVGRRWYADYPVAADARLNDRTAAMIGRDVRVETAIAGGTGRVAIGDGSWPARGPDTPVGRTVRIVAVEDGVVVVEPLSGGLTPVRPEPVEGRAPGTSLRTAAVHGSAPRSGGTNPRRASTENSRAAE